MVDKKNQDSRALVNGVLPFFLGIILCFFVLDIATDVTSKLDAPVETDFFRDIGAAQSILDGAGAADPAYKGEARWYNPLVPFLMATLSRITGVGLPVLYTQWGAYINLLVPLSFFILMITLLGAWPALAALVAFVFFGQLDQEVWHQATYTPWLWPMEFAQVLAYATLMALWFSLQTGRLVWHLLCGALLGITMLGHTAPALIISSMVIVFTITGVLSGGNSRQHWYRLWVIGGVSLLFSLPFLLPILVHYQFKVVNEAPMQHVFLYPGDVLRGVLSIRGLVAAFGLAALLFFWRHFGISNMQRRFVLVWLAVATSFFLYGIVAIFLRPRLGISLPKIVPTFHFGIYFKAVESVLFGIGLVLILNFFADRIRKVYAVNVNNTRVLGIFLALAVLIVLRLPDYRHRYDLSHYVVESQKFAAEKSLQQLYNALLYNLNPDEVVLADNRVGMQSVIAAGRKIVAIDPVYSNPYVDYNSRAFDRDAMFVALQQHQNTLFLELASKYDVGYVAAGNKDNNSSLSACCWLPGDVDTSLLELMLEFEGVSLYRVKLQ